jgi:hypothetical protein
LSIQVSVIMSLLSGYLPLAGGTMTGDINLGAHLLKTTNLALKQYDATYWIIRNTADTASKSLMADKVKADTSFESGGNPTYFDTANIDDYSTRLRARENGVGLVEIARLVSAAEPYFQITRSLLLLPQAAAPGTLVEGMLWYDNATDLVQLRKAASTAVLATRGACLNAITTTWVTANTGGEHDKVSIAGHGVVRFVHTGDGDGTAASRASVRIDGTETLLLESNVAAEYCLIFNSSLIIHVNGNGSNEYSGGACYGNYET